MKIIPSVQCNSATTALCFAAIFTLASHSLHANEIINDSFADGDRSRTGSLDADWWSSNQTSGSNVEAAPGSLTLVTGTSGRGMHATFSPQTLAVGDSITVTYSFTTPATVVGVGGTAFKIALMDFNNAGLAADLSSQSGAGNENPLYVGQPGYFTSFDVGTTATTQDIDFRKHDVTSPLGRFLGTTSEWNSISSSADNGYAFAANTDYVGVLRVTRTGTDSHELFSSLSLAGGALLDSHTTSDSSDIANNFGMLGFWVNSNAFGSSNTAGDPDNGLVFSNVTIETTIAPVSNAVVDDSFADGNVEKTGFLDADWWSSSQPDGSNVEIAPGALTLVTGTSGRGMHATFKPQDLEVGDKITVTYSFTTPATIGNPSSSSFKIALMDFNNTALASNLSSMSGAGNENLLYVGQPGYFTSFDVGTTATTQDTDFRKHDVTSPLGRFLGTTSEWISISSSANIGYVFLPNTDYVGIFEIERTGEDSLTLFSSLSLDGGAVLDSHSASDNSDIANNFGMLGFWANGNAFGSSNSAGDPDNGLVFTNVLIESTVEDDSPVTIPILPVWAFLILGVSLVGMTLKVRKA